MDMNRLPVLCVEEILSYLSVSDKICCLSVCPLWRHILQRLLLRHKEIYIARLRSRRRDVLVETDVFGHGGMGISKVLYSLKRLESIHVGEMSEGFATYKHELIRHLGQQGSAIRCLQLGDLDISTLILPVFKRMMKHLPDLRKFVATFTEGQGQGDDTSDAYTECLLLNCQNLEHLDLHASRKLCSGAFRGIANHSVQTLILKDCKNVDYSIFQHMANSQVQQTLEVFDIANTNIIGAESLVNLSRFSNLKSLSLPRSFSRRCTLDVNEPTTMAYLTELRHIEVLKLGSGFCMHDKDLKLFAEKCLKLKSFSVTSNPGHVSQQGLGYLRHFGSLESLAIGPDLPLCDDHLCSLIKLGNLKQLLINYCHCVTLQGLHELGISSRSLAYISVRGNFNIKEEKRLFEQFIQTFAEDAVNQRQEKICVEFFDISRWDHDWKWKHYMEVQYSCSPKLRLRLV